jgi:hypothetical protein
MGEAAARSSRQRPGMDRRVEPGEDEEVVAVERGKSWMAGTRPAMTN